MNLTVKVYYDPYNPALYFCDVYAAWQLWWELRNTKYRVELWDCDRLLDPHKGLNNCMPCQQYKPE